jgi:hypothetical protein
MESAYRLSLVVQNLSKDVKTGNKAAILNDIDVIITRLPDTLEICDQSELADNVRKYLPLDCVHSVENLFELIPMLLQNYEHFEWLAKNYPIYLNAFALIAMQCPIFY